MCVRFFINAIHLCFVQILNISFVITTKKKISFVKIYACLTKTGNILERDSKDGIFNKQNNI